MKTNRPGANRAAAGTPQKGRFLVTQPYSTTIDPSRQPPPDRDPYIERALLRECLFDPAYFADLQLEASDFTDSRYRALWRYGRERAMRGERVDAILLTSAIASGDLDVTRDALADIQSAETTDSAYDYAARLRELSTNRKLHQGAQLFIAAQNRPPAEQQALVARAVGIATDAIASDVAQDAQPQSFEVVWCPALPAGVGLDPALAAGAGAWLDEYTAHAMAVSPMTPRVMHESAGLWLGSTAIARRLKLPMAFADVYPNLWVFWLATTTLWRKTTAMEVARELARRAFPQLLAPQDMTPEGFLSDLSGREPANLAQLPLALNDLWQQGRAFCAQRGLVVDELSGLLAAAGKDYNAGLLEAFLRFYDCDPQYSRSTRGSGLVVVRDAYLTILGASTPAAMAQHVMSERLWSNGWWARFAILTPEDARPTWSEPRDEDPAVSERLATGLRHLYQALPIPVYPAGPEARTVPLGEGVMDAWRAYNRALSYDLLTDDLDHRLHGAYGRLPTHCLKVAMILAALDWRGQDGPAPVIELRHLARAMGVTEAWRASAHRALAQVTASEFDHLQRRVMRHVSKFEPNGATMRDIYRQMQDQQPEVVKRTIEQMIELGMIELVTYSSGPKGGRPSERYRLAR